GQTRSWDTGRPPGESGEKPPQLSHDANLDQAPVSGKQGRLPAWPSSPFFELTPARPGLQLRGTGKTSQTTSPTKGLSDGPTDDHYHHRHHGHWGRVTALSTSDADRAKPGGGLAFFVGSKPGV